MLRPGPKSSYLSACRVQLAQPIAFQLDKALVARARKTFFDRLGRRILQCEAVGKPLQFRKGTE